MTRKPEIHENKIIIPSDPNLIGEVDEFVESKLRSRRVSDSVIADIAICATEIVNNGIIHGNKENPEKTVTLEIDFTHDQIVIRIIDQGNFFNPDPVADPIADANLMREVGRGIFIVRHLMDGVDISHAVGGGTMVTLIKKIA